MEVNVGGGRVCVDVEAGEACLRLDDRSLELGPADTPAKKSGEIQKNNMVRKHKHVVPIKRSKGPVKITDTEIAVGDISCCLYDTITTDEVNRVRGALRASSEELQARVKDPLPDALQLAGNLIAEMARKLSNQGTLAKTQCGEGVDTVISELARKIMNPDPLVKNQNGKDAGSSLLSAKPSAENQSGKDTDACNPSANHTVEASVENLNQTEVDDANP
ncbi:unnamed protein product [Dovyalis caffra]|uniref:Uncharacterized protein n=1 Tax=Dovyalis caffra TaxID=77055 RepID=A0AAV1QW20_9ROSI|nr:unnamed protein product [Dovyalis caffra]